MPNPKDFLLNTDYELDKIILTKSGSFTSNKDIPHSLGFTPLPFGVWSTDSNFNSVNPLGVTDSSGEQGYTPMLGVNCIAFGDKITLTASGAGAGTTTIYYRLYAFAPSGSNVDTPTTSSLANTFLLNTDYNYRKLKATGEFTQSNETYTHNLGYLPQVMAWNKYVSGSDSWSDGIAPLVSASNSTNAGVTVTTTQIKAGTITPFVIEKIIWRVYHDEA